MSRWTSGPLAAAFSAAGVTAALVLGSGLALADPDPPPPPGVDAPAPPPPGDPAPPPPPAAPGCPIGPGAGWAAGHSGRLALGSRRRPEPGAVHRRAAVRAADLQSS